MDELAQFFHLRSWLLGMTALPDIILDRPDAVRPTGTYGMLNLLNAERINWSDFNEYEASATGTAEPMVQIPVETWEFQWSFNVYGTNPMAALSFAGSAELSDAAALKLHPMVLNRTSNIRRLPEMVQTKWEDRAQTDLFIHAHVRNGFVVDIVETATVNASGVYGGNSGVVVEP